MKRIFTLFLAILFCLLTACGAGGTAQASTPSSPADTPTAPAETSLSKTPGTDETDTTGSASAPSETSGTTVVDEFFAEEDPILSEPLLTIGGYTVPYGLYRYFYCSMRDFQLEKDETHYDGQDRAQTLLADADEFALISCRQTAAYFKLAEQFGKLPENYDEEFENYLSTLAMTAAYYGVTVSEYLGGYLPKSVLRILYEENYFLVPAVTETLEDEEKGYIDMSEAAVAELAKDYRTVKHILVGYSDGLSDEEALALANDLIERYKNGEDFDALIEEYSNDYHAGTENTYTFSHGEMVAEFEETAFKLEENELSGPVRSAYGYHIILRLPLAEDFAENYYLSAAVNKYLTDFADALEVEKTDLYNGLTDAKIG